MGVSRQASASSHGLGRGLGGNNMQRQQQQPTTGQQGQGDSQEEEAEACELEELCTRSPRPDDRVVTYLELPRMVAVGGLLSARTLGPRQVTAGIAFTFSLQVGCSVSAVCRSVCECVCVCLG